MHQQSTGQSQRGEGGGRRDDPLCLVDDNIFVCALYYGAVGREMAARHVIRRVIIRRTPLTYEQKHVTS